MLLINNCVSLTNLPGSRKCVNDQNRGYQFISLYGTTKLVWWGQKICRTEGRREVALVQLAFCDESVAAIRFSCWNVLLSISVDEISLLQGDVLYNTSPGLLNVVLL